MSIQFVPSYFRTTMQLIRDFSGRTVLFIFIVFAFVFGNKMADVAKDKQTCLCSYDGFGYYMYLPYFFEHQSLAMTQEWSQDIQNTYCNGTGAYQIVRHKNGGELNTYHMGLAFVYLPSYIIGDVSARILGYDTDGFSKPYHIAFLLNALLFIFLGLLYLRKLLLLFFGDNTTSIVLLVLFASTNLFITYHLQYSLQHLYLFALNAIFLYHIIQFSRNERRKHLFLAAIILGLTVAIRPTQAIWGLIPLVLLFDIHGHSRAFWKQLLLFPLFGFIWNIPQILYWWMIGGEAIILNLHTEDLALTDPNLIDFLFSYKKGWLLYSPIFILTFIGFYAFYQKDKKLASGSFLFVLLYMLVMSSWECWWYASSYGSRVMVDVYPLLAIPLGYFVIALNSVGKKIIGYGIIGAFALLNIIQTIQFDIGYLHSEKMTKQHYWYIFGKTDIPDYTSKHLEMDRDANDSKWVQLAQNLAEEDGYNYQKKVIYQLDKPLTSVPNQDVTIGRFCVMDKIPTDESMFEVTIVTKTSDSTKSAVLRMEICSSYNCYNWQTRDISLGAAQGEYVTHHFYFSLDNIRHRTDQMQLYVNIWEDLQIEVKSMQITAHSLIRK